MFSTFSTGQVRHLNVGPKGNGICFGNSADHNGIRLNLRDKRDENVHHLNGISIAGISRCRTINGISISVLTLACKRSNGIIIGGLGVEPKNHNGIAVGGLYISGTKCNGIGIAGMSPYADTLNGVFAGLWGVMSLNKEDSIKVINGLAVGGMGVIASEMNGVSVAYFLNSFHKQKGVSIASINLTHELHGFQFGLINHAANNRRFLKWTPVFNFNLRKKSGT